MKHRSLAAILLFITLIGGCGPKAGDPLLTYERGSMTVPPLTTVDKPGKYALFPGNGIVPLETISLHKGDHFGFVSRDGKVVGTYTIGGETRMVPLDAVVTTEYVWKMQDEK